MGNPPRGLWAFYLPPWRLAWVLPAADRFRKQLTQAYGDEAGAKVEFAEAFELCEYGRQPSKEELQQMFPKSPAR